jgi:hypothetical protein
MGLDPRSQARRNFAGMRVEASLTKTRVCDFVPLFANKKDAEDQAFGRRVLSLRRL